MDKEMFTFLKNAISKNLCSEYKKEWKASVEDKKKLFDFSMQTGSIPYLATAIYRGWAVPIDYITQNFKDFINGKYVIENSNGIKGATATSYYDYNFDGEELHFTLATMYHCCGSFDVMPHTAQRYHISNKSDLSIGLGDNSTLWINLYDESKVDLGYIEQGMTAYIIKYSDDCSFDYIDCGGKVVVRRRDVDVDAFYEVKNT